MGIKKAIKIIFLVIIVAILSFIIFMFIGLSSVSKNEDIVSFVVNTGDSKVEIIENLKEAGLIKSSIALKIYLALDYSKDIMAGDYKLDRSLSATEILNKLQTGEYEYIKNESIMVTFVEGKRLTEYAQVIADNFGYEYNEVIEVLNNREFLETLVSKYTILTDEILNEDLYYPLEGYLYPDTYELYIDASIEDIVEKLISQLSYKLSSENLAIEESNYTVHELLTLASIVELEANSMDDRYVVAEVIYNRLNIGMTLGMDVTTYYGSKINMGEDLTKTQLNDYNAYNTRAAGFYGLPVGSICNPSLQSIIATLYPSNGDNLYFFADIDTGKVNFFLDYTAFYKYAYGG